MQHYDYLDRLNNWREQNELYQEKQDFWIEQGEHLTVTLSVAALSAGSSVWLELIEVPLLERVLKWVILALTLLYKEDGSYKWEGCKRIQRTIQRI